MRCSAACSARPGDRLLVALTSSASAARTTPRRRRPRRDRRTPTSTGRRSRCRPTRGSARCSSAAGTCTPAPAAVLHSTAGDLILTAAHCVAGGRRHHVRRRLHRHAPTRRTSGTSTRSTSTRAGWRTRIRWPTSRSLRVSRDAGGTVGGAAGGGLTLGAGPETGHRRHRHRLRAGRRRRPDRLPDRPRRRRAAFRRCRAAGWSTAPVGRTVDRRTRRSIGG